MTPSLLFPPGKLVSIGVNPPPSNGEYPSPGARIAAMAFGSAPAFIAHLAQTSEAVPASIAPVIICSRLPFASTAHLTTRQGFLDPRDQIAGLRPGKIHADDQVFPIKVSSVMILQCEAVSRHNERD